MANGFRKPRSTFRSRSRARPRSLPRTTRKGIKRTIRRYKDNVFRKKVKRVIRSVAETKHYSVASSRIGYSLSTYQTTLNGNLMILTPPTAGEAGIYSAPQINQGTADGQRIGNRINIKRAMLRLIFAPVGYDATLNPTPKPLDCCIYFFRTKNNQQSIVTAGQLEGPAGTFFQDGTGNIGFQGGLLDLTRVMNKDRFIYLGHRKFKLGFAGYNGTGTGIDAANEYFWNNDYSMNKIFRIPITKLLPKHFTWDDSGNTTTPYTYAIVQATWADNNLVPITNTVFRMQVEQYYEYTDV